MSDKRTEEIKQLAKDILIASVENSGMTHGVYGNGRSAMMDRIELSIKIAKDFYLALERGE